MGRNDQLPCHDFAFLIYIVLQIMVKVFGDGYVSLTT